MDTHSRSLVANHQMVLRQRNYGSITSSRDTMGTSSEKLDIDKKSNWSMTRVFTLLVVLLVGLAVGAVISYLVTRSAFSPSSATTEKPKEDSGPTAEELRLPTSAEPLSYDLTIKTYLPGYVDIPKDKNLTFEGQVKIAINVKQDVRKFVLNSNKLEYIENKCELIVDEKPVKIKSIMVLEKFEKVAFDLEEVVAAGKTALLKIKYMGKINDNLGGIYQSLYTETDGTKKIAATTQMEPTDARQMVPCFDEPEYKANWTVTVIHPKGTTAISNGIEVSTSPVDDNFLSTVFETTPRMSSYLLAILVSEFEFREKMTDSGIRFRVWSRPEAKNQTEYALEAGVKCIEFYEKYFNISFPLKKQDMVAVPDFAAGAMENWGLITYRENSLLYDTALYPPAQKRRVAVVIAHELAHQWFGNLVTMQWWDDLWLNEGFASYVEYLGTDEISDGNYKMENYFLEKAFVGSLMADDKASSHPLSFRIDKALEVSEAFDTISYDKGASVLRMIKQVLGSNNFKNGLYEYLNKHKYANARAIDLWEAFDNNAPNDLLGASGNKINVSYFASQWTSQMGFPYITAKRLNESVVAISQNRFKVNKDAKEKTKYANPMYKFKWDVPVWYQKGDGDVQMKWLSRDEDLIISHPSSSPLVINADSHAFVRQNYDSAGWEAIVKQLNDNHLVYSNRTRHAIISDAFAMSAIEQLSYPMMFDLLEYIKKEEDYLPNAAFFAGMTTIGKYFGTEPEAKSFSEYISKRIPVIDVKATMKRIADNYLDDTKFYENMLELKRLQTICSFGSVQCNTEMKEAFKTEVIEKCKAGDRTSQCVDIAAPNRATIYCMGVKNGDQGTFEKMMAFYKRETVQLEQNNLLNALACSRDPQTLKTLLLTTIDRSSNVIRLQDAATVFNAVANNDIGKEFMFGFFLQRWNDIYESFKSEPASMGRVIVSCTSNIRTKQDVDALIHFRDTAKHASSYSAITQQIESQQETVSWISKNYNILTKLFKERV